MASSPSNEHAAPSGLMAYQHCIRKWMPYLTAHEFAVLMQLLDRTIGWQKTRATFSLNRVLNGDRAYGGIREMVSRASLFRALGSLEAKGMIARHKHPQGKQIKEYSVNMGWTPALLNRPENAQNDIKSSATARRDPSHDETSLVSHCDTRERRGRKGKQENEEDAGHRPSADDTALIDPSEIIRKAKADVADRRCKPDAKKPTTLPQKVDAAQREWRHAIEETCPTGGMLAWSQREVAIVKSKIKGWNDRRTEFHVFIGWCARNWPLVCRKKLSWMTKSPPPKVPTVGFLLSFIEHFQEAFYDKDLENWMNADERRKYDRLIASGLSHDEALVSVAKDETATALRDEIAKEKRDIAVRRGMLKRQEQRIEARQRKAPVVVDPRSPAAQAARRAEQGIQPTKRLTEEELNAIDLNALPPLDPNWEPA